MVDFFSSVFNNYKSKITNPFFGTLITVWIIRNWSIVYAFFMFDKDCTMQNKIDYINEYFAQKDFWSELAINLGLTFGVLVFSYILLSIGRSLSDLYYKRCEPWIVTRIDKAAILIESDKVILENRIELLASKNISLRDDLTTSEDSNRYVSEQLLKTRQELESTSSAYKLEIKQLIEIHGKSNELKAIFDPVISDFNKLIYNVFDSDFLLNDNLTIDSRLLNNTDVRDVLIKKGFLALNGRKPEYTNLGKSFLNYYSSLNNLKK